MINDGEKKYMDIQGHQILFPFNEKIIGTIYPSFNDGIEDDFLNQNWRIFQGQIKSCFYHKTRNNFVQRSDNRHRNFEKLRCKVDV